MNSNLTLDEQLINAVRENEVIYNCVNVVNGVYHNSKMKLYAERHNFGVKTHFVAIMCVFEIWAAPNMDDKLIGFGETQVTVWDYRSGDVLMNYDLEIPMGKNLGSFYFPSQDIEQNNMLILHQFRNSANNGQSKLITIACTVTHTQPSYKVLQETDLPLPAFKLITSAIRTGDHLVIADQDGDEIWISSTNPRLMTVVPRLQHTKRFYGRERSQLIELTEKTLNVNSLTNHILQLAAG